VTVRGSMSYLEDAVSDDRVDFHARGLATLRALGFTLFMGLSGSLLFLSSLPSSPLLLLPIFPFPALPHAPIRNRPSNTAGVWEPLLAPPAGSRVQGKSNLVHFSLKI